MNERLELLDGGNWRMVSLDDLPALFDARHPNGIDPLRTATVDDLHDHILTIPGIAQVRQAEPEYNRTERRLMAEGYTSEEAARLAVKLEQWGEDPDAGCLRYAHATNASEVDRYRASYANGERLFYESKDVVLMVGTVPILAGYHWKSRD